MLHAAPRARRFLNQIAVAVLVCGGWMLVGSAVARADAVLDWNEIALATTARAPFDPPRESRSLAIVHAAMFDAVNAIAGEFEPYAPPPEVPRSASPEAAAVAAAHRALSQLYPVQQAQLDAAYERSLSAISMGADRRAGIDAGVAVATRLLALRADDGADAAASEAREPEPPAQRPGLWIPTPPGFAAPLDPDWGAVRPFLLRSASQFRPPPPPALDSSRYTRDFIEIRAIGSATSSTRSQAQTDLARFWVATAPQNWNPLARRMALARGLSLAQNARAFALLNLACADAFIAAWRVKFTDRQWRPVTAIRAADEDGNPRTLADPAWTPLLVTPPFPDYVAGHTAYAGAAAAVLEHLFGRRPGTPLVMTSGSAPGVTETYRSFDDIAQGVVDARVWGGVHWRTSSARGQRMGARIGHFAIHHFAAPRRTLRQGGRSD